MLTDLRRNLRLVCVCACLLFVSGVFVLRAGFGDREDAAIVPGADHIVRLRDQDGVPFDVAAGEELRALLRAGNVVWYEEDAPVLLQGEDGGCCYYEAYQWDLDMIGAPTAFDRNAAGQGIGIFYEIIRLS